MTKLKTFALMLGLLLAASFCHANEVAGNYVVSFTLPDGDEYYGEFTVAE